MRPDDPRDLTDDDDPVWGVSAQLKAGSHNVQQKIFVLQIRAAHAEWRLKKANEDVVTMQNTLLELARRVARLEGPAVSMEMQEVSAPMGSDHSDSAGEDRPTAEVGTDGIISENKEWQAWHTVAGREAKD